MKEKLLNLLGGLLKLGMEALSEAGGFGWAFATTLLMKLLKSELWVAAGAIVGSLMAPKLGIPEDSLASLWATLGGIALAYIGGRSYAKPKELGDPPKAPAGI